MLPCWGYEPARKRSREDRRGGERGYAGQASAGSGSVAGMRHAAFRCVGHARAWEREAQLPRVCARVTRGAWGVHVLPAPGIFPGARVDSRLTTVRSRYERQLIWLNMKKKWPTRTGMEDSRPIFFCKRFSYNENALYPILRLHPLRKRAGPR